MLRAFNLHKGFDLSYRKNMKAWIEVTAFVTAQIHCAKTLWLAFDPNGTMHLTDNEQMVKAVGRVYCYNMADLRSVHTLRTLVLDQLSQHTRTQGENMLLF